MNFSSQLHQLLFSVATPSELTGRLDPFTDNDTFVAELPEVEAASEISVSKGSPLITYDFLGEGYNSKFIQYNILTT
ncbi:MAG: hypothetical protein IPQ02_10660 [Saprospiraceae bacterium]|nr:hypothetical protein [Candidatus Defluviibacterium haderslevense]